VSLVREWGALSVTVRHASPWDEDTYLYPDSPSLNRIELGARELIVLGHTHYPMQVRRGRGRVVNPGSVGQPRDWNPSASYALLDTATGAWTPRRAVYDHTAYQLRLETLGWEQQPIQLLGRRRESLMTA
jgi:diadenosine tetraphosphatase ApaH/serine/threonine PP2A family protein phosphatase